MHVAIQIEYRIIPIVTPALQMSGASANPAGLTGARATPKRAPSESRNAANVRSMSGNKYNQYGLKRPRYIIIIINISENVYFR